MLLLLFRRFLGASISLTLVFALAACSVSGSDSASTPAGPKTPVPLESERTPAAGASPVAGPASTPGTASASATPGTVRATPRIPENAIILDPPDLVAVAASGRAELFQGSSYWQLLNGLAQESHSRGIQIQEQPLTLGQGETVTFEWVRQSDRSESTLEELTLAVYQKDPNIKLIETQRGNFNGFVPQTEPSAKASLSTQSPSWTVNVAPGAYFIAVNARWSNPVDPPKPRFAEYAVVVDVR